VTGKPQDPSAQPPARSPRLGAAAALSRKQFFAWSAMAVKAGISHSAFMRKRGPRRRFRLVAAGAGRGSGVPLSPPGAAATLPVVCTTARASFATFRDISGDSREVRKPRNFRGFLRFPGWVGNRLANDRTAAPGRQLRPLPTRGRELGGQVGITWSLRVSTGPRRLPGQAAPKVPRAPGPCRQGAKVCHSGNFGGTLGVGPARDFQTRTCATKVSRQGGANWRDTFRLAARCRKTTAAHPKPPGRRLPSEGASRCTGPRRPAQAETAGAYCIDSDFNPLAELEKSYSG
jgi:hypothetical protein